MTAVWAKLVGDSARAEGFEQWMTQTWESHLKADDLASLTPEERSRAESRLRFGKIVCAAVIEAARAEDAVGNDRAVTLCDITQFMAVALTALISLTIEPDGFDGAIDLLTDQFTKMVSDHIETVRA